MHVIRRVLASLVVSVIAVVPGVSSAQFTSGQVLTAAQLNSALAAKTNNSSAAILGGTINNASVGATTPSSGAFTTLAVSGALTQPSTAQFYQNLGANVNRVNDRVFLGSAAINDGTSTGTQDYVSQNIPQGPTTSISQSAFFSTIGAIGLMGASRTSDAPNAGTEGSIAVMGVNINNATGANQQIGQGAYFEAQQKTGAGFTAGVEVDTVNQSGTVNAMNPYNMVNGTPYTVNNWLAAGGARSSVVASSAAVGVVDNGAQFDKGIVFQSGSLVSNEALAMPSSAALQWWSSSTTPSSYLNSIATGSGNYGIELADAATYIGNSPTSNAAASIAVNNIANAVDYVAVSGSTTGFAPQIAAAGSDANITLGLIGKGTGGVAIANTNAGASALELTGNGSTTPNKFLGVLSGNFTIYSSNASTNLLTLTDAGSLSAVGINSTPVGGTAASTGAFTTLTASGTVSGTGFSNYLASPPAIGSTAPAAGKFTTLQATSSITPSTTAGIVGTTLADNAVTGSIGEYVTSNVAAGSAVGLTSLTPANVTSISLGAGDWDISGVVFTNPGASTVQLQTVAAIATSSATLGAPNETISPYTAATGAVLSVPTPTVRMNISSTTTVYLVAMSGFTTSTNAAFGFIRARRVR